MGSCCFLSECLTDCSAETVQILLPPSKCVSSTECTTVGSSMLASFLVVLRALLRLLMVLSGERYCHKLWRDVSIMCTWCIPARACQHSGIIVCALCQSQQMRAEALYTALPIRIICVSVNLFTTAYGTSPLHPCPHCILTDVFEMICLFHAVACEW